MTAAVLASQEPQRQLADKGRRCEEEIKTMKDQCREAILAERQAAAARETVREHEVARLREAHRSEVASLCEAQQEEKGRLSAALQLLTHNAEKKEKELWE